MIRQIFNYSSHTDRQDNIIKPKNLTSDMLSAFIKKSDALGGEFSEKCKKYWMHMSYKPTVKINTTLDPTSKEYVSQQMALYKELTGHSYEVDKDEDNTFDVNSFVKSPTAYFDKDPDYINNHMHAMSLFMKQISSTKPLKILELGSGWGFCCEYLARLGHTVTGVDINKLYIDGANKRKQKANLQATYIQSTFEKFKTTEKFDIIFFYEAFHHSSDAFSLLKKLRKYLKKDGTFAIIAEPFIDNSTWPHWGLRLDPLAVYTIRKKGWFESGWTVNYMKSLYRKVGLRSKYINYPESDITHYLLGKISNKFQASQFDLWKSKGWYDENETLVSSGDSSLEFEIPKGIKKIKLYIENRYKKELFVHIESPKLRKRFNLTVGRNEIIIPVKNNTDFFLKFRNNWWNRWISDDVFKNGDRREISFHLTDIEYL